MFGVEIVAASAALYILAVTRKIGFTIQTLAFACVVTAGILSLSNDLFGNKVSVGLNLFWYFAGDWCVFAAFMLLFFLWRDLGSTYIGNANRFIRGPWPTVLLCVFLVILFCLATIASVLVNPSLFSSFFIAALLSYGIIMAIYGYRLAHSMKNGSHAKRVKRITTWIAVNSLLSCICGVLYIVATRQLTPAQ